MTTISIAAPDAMVVIAALVGAAFNCGLAAQLDSSRPAEQRDRQSLSTPAFNVVLCQDELGRLRFRQRHTTPSSKATTHSSARNLAGQSPIRR